MSNVSRSVEMDGMNATVSLKVSIYGMETYYLIDEVIPFGCEVVDAGVFSTTEPEHLKFVKIHGAVSTTYRYTMTVPRGYAGAFIGTYMIEGDTEENRMEGSRFITTNKIEVVKPTPVVVPYEPEEIIPGVTNVLGYNAELRKKWDNIADKLIRELRRLANGEPIMYDELQAIRNASAKGYYDDLRRIKD